MLTKTGHFNQNKIEAKGVKNKHTFFKKYISIKISTKLYASVSISNRLTIQFNSYYYKIQKEQVALPLKCIKIDAE